MCHFSGEVKSLMKREIKKQTRISESVFGGDEEDRTLYLYTASVALSQLSYAPKYILSSRLNYYSKNE